MRAILLGFTVSQEMIDEIIPLDPNLPLQTYRFSWSLARSLRYAGFNVDLVSAVPVTNYPGTDKLLFGAKEFVQDDIKGTTISFINCFFLKHLTRFFSSLSHIYAVRKCRDNGYIFIHGVHSPFLLTGLLFKSEKLKALVVLTDPPNVIFPTDDFLSRWVKRVDGFFIRFLLGKMDGSICLSEHIVSDLAPKTPSLVIPGFLDKALMDRVQTYRGGENDRVFVVAYAGALDRRYGIDNLIEAVRKISDFPIRLDLYGKGDMVNRLKDNEFGSAICYRGVLAPAELYERLSAVDVILNPRPSSAAFTKYSFPSKLIESLALSVPVMSTVLDGIPDDFFNFIWPIHDESSSGIADAIKIFRDATNEERRERVLMGRRFVEENFSEQGQGKKISSFLNQHF